MTTFIEEARRYYEKEYDVTPLLLDVQSSFSSSITEIKPVFVALIDKLQNASPSKYWNRKTAHQVFDKLESCLSPGIPTFCFNEEAIEYFLMGYNAYEQLSETWADIHDFNISPEIKTRLYRLPLYTSIVEGCLSNLLRFLAIPLSKCAGKDYTVQSKLNPLLDMAQSNGLNEIADHVDVNIRNAINHGRVSIQKEGGFDHLVFYYMENHQSRKTELPLYEFDQQIDEAYDMVSGVILGIALFMNQHISLLDVDKTKKGYIPFSLFAMELSTPVNRCVGISDVPNDEQINVDMHISDCKDRGHLVQLAITLSILVYTRYQNYKKYYISFSHPRMLTGWMRFTQAQIIEMITKKPALDDIAKQVLNNDSLFFPPSEEEIDPSEYKYYCFPNYTKDGITINEVADCSLPDRKRLKAHMFIGDITDKEELLRKIDTAIEWLKTVKNPPSPKYPQKHGNMPADSIYLNVYKYDERRNKELLPNNENFVCFVDYNQSGTTTLKDGGILPSIWNRLFHETIGLLQIAWREKKNLTAHSIKIRRNDPCPCGSGKKYKNCCGR